MSALRWTCASAAMAGCLVLAFLSGRLAAQEIDPSGHGHASHAVAAPPQDTDRDARSDDATTATTSHVPPPPPEHAMSSMGAAGMLDTMEMNDDATHAMVKLDRFERAFGGDAPAFAWDADASIGRDFDKLRLRSEGERIGGALERADVEALWSHAAAPYWDSEIGVRRDFGRGPGRSWAAFGVQGLAPYWFELAATAYVGNGGRTAVRFEGAYELSLTQRWILQPRVEVDAYGRSDPATGTGSGLADAAIGLRVRYEIRREIAPYIGIEWSRRFGQTATLTRDEGFDADDTRIVAGLRFWY